jgi:hypothetical protein
MRKLIGYVLLTVVTINVVLLTTQYPGTLLEFNKLFVAMLLLGSSMVDGLSDLGYLSPFHVEAAVYQDTDSLDSFIDLYVSFADNPNDEASGSNQGGNSKPFTEVPHVPAEVITHEHGVANVSDATIRDRVIADGYDPAQTNQPYAGKLAAKLKQLAKLEQHKSIPKNLLSGDAEYLRNMHFRAHDVYEPNVHYPNTDKVRNFLKNLP